MVLTETWLKESGDESKIADLTPPGYKLFSFPRQLSASIKGGGGIAVIMKDCLASHTSINTTLSFTHTSFEIDQVAFSRDVANVVTHDTCFIDLNTGLRQVFDKHAPLRQRRVQQRRSAPCSAVPTPLISSPPSQPHTGPLRRNLKARSPLGATNVRSPRGHLPEEALHFCWVTSVVFSGAFL
ncbi:hypothetical protein ACOMHN_014565 [Nucella lapillus]